MPETPTREQQQRQQFKSIRRLCDQSVSYLKATTKIPINKLSLAEQQRELDKDLVNVLVESWVNETMEVHRNLEMKAIITLEEWARLEKDAEEARVSVKELLENGHNIRAKIWSGQHRLAAARKYATKKKIHDEENYWIVAIYTEGSRFTINKSLNFS